MVGNWYWLSNTYKSGMQIYGVISLGRLYNFFFSIFILAEDDSNVITELVLHYLNFDTIYTYTSSSFNAGNESTNPSKVDLGVNEPAEVEVEIEVKVLKNSEDTLRSEDEEGWGADPLTEWSVW